MISPLFQCTVDWIKKNKGEAVLLARLSIFNGHMHVYFIEVEYDDNGIQVPVHDPYGRLDDAYASDPDGAYETVRVPGFDGNYVPFAVGYKS